MLHTLPNHRRILILYTYNNIVWCATILLLTLKFWMASFEIGPYAVLCKCCHKFMSTASKARTHTQIVRAANRPKWKMNGLNTQWPSSSVLVSNGHLNWFYSVDNSVADLFNQKLLSLSVYYNMATAQH